MSKTVVCLVFGGQSTEHEVSLMSAMNVASAISREKYDVLLVGIDKSGAWWLYRDGSFAVNGSDPARIALASGGLPVVPLRSGGRPALAALSGEGPFPFDVMFPVLHGHNGEDGAMQGLARLLGCPCVGCDVTSSAICMDKAFAKQILEYEGIRTAPWILVCKEAPRPAPEEIAARLGMPVFVKPANAGSSVGVEKATELSMVDSAIDNAMKYDDRVLVEKAIVGREIECAVMGNADVFCALPGEIVPKCQFYSYEAKYTMADGADLMVPAVLEEEQIARVSELAVRAYRTLGCRGMSRVDFFLQSDGSFILNEINTIPGFTKISMFPKLMGVSGISYPELVERLIVLARES